MCNFLYAPSLHATPDLYTLISERSPRRALYFGIQHNRLGSNCKQRLIEGLGLLFLLTNLNQVQRADLARSALSAANLANAGISVITCAMYQVKCFPRPHCIPLYHR